MKGFVAAAAFLVALIPDVSAHYRFTSLILNGAATGEYQYVRPYTSYNSPVTDVSSTAFRCNTGSSPAPQTATVAAGSTIGFKLDQAIYHAVGLVLFLLLAS
ncbi:hypothetical protein FRC03_011313 [Tulasnella sp. 419]|nr:hypothetical protein FRC03_011313 [Tulasnella sp. 419]